MCAGGRQKIALNSADKVFRDLRDLSFAAVGPQLGQRAKSIQSDYKTSKVANSTGSESKFMVGQNYFKTHSEPTVVGAIPNYLSLLHHMKIL